MGYAKEQLIKEAESGFNSAAVEGKFVCTTCISDPALKDVVTEALTNEACVFCDTESGAQLAAPLETLVEHIVQCLRVHYDDAVNYQVDDGYLCKTFDTWEVLDEIGLGDCVADGREELLDTIRDSVEDTRWCERNPLELPLNERLTLSWERFCDYIKHKQRFIAEHPVEGGTVPIGVFLSGDKPEYVDDDDGGDRFLDPSQMLKSIAKHCVGSELIVFLRKESRLYRARKEEGSQPFRSALDLGAPPPDKATQSNRMSPPGVVMTYLAEDEETALTETAGPERADYSVAEFELRRDLAVLDLTEVPQVPSVFDLKRVFARDVAVFLRGFAEDVSKPISHDDGRQHVEYVPTQAFTEYVRGSSDLQMAGVQGLRYRSAQREGGVCLVLFGGRELLELSETERAALLPAERHLAAKSAPCLRLAQVKSRTYP